MGAIECLDLAFLIHAQHQSAPRRVQIKPHNVANPPDAGKGGLRNPVARATVRTDQWVPWGHGREPWLESAFEW